MGETRPAIRPALLNQGRDLSRYHGAAPSLLHSTTGSHTSLQESSESDALPSDPSPETPVTGETHDTEVSDCYRGSVDLLTQYSRRAPNASAVPVSHTSLVERKCDLVLTSSREEPEGAFSSEEY